MTANGQGGRRGAWGSPGADEGHGLGGRGKQKKGPEGARPGEGLTQQRSLSHLVRRFQHLHQEGVDGRVAY